MRRRGFDAQYTVVLCISLKMRNCEYCL